MFEDGVFKSVGDDGDFKTIKVKISNCEANTIKANGAMRNNKACMFMR